jgi:hypothetical protein
MKIVICVDYSHKQFNKDFELSNRLIVAGHHVFLAINNVQFEYFRDNCDVCIKGYSCSWEDTSLDISGYTVDSAIEYINQIKI